MQQQHDYRPLFRFSTRSLMLLTLSAAFASCVTIAWLAPEPTRDMLSDVDRKILSKCHSEGLYCTCSEPTGFYNHGKLKIKAFSGGEYHVYAIRLLGNDLESFLPMLNDMPELKRISIPYSTRGELDALAAKYPNWEFTDDMIGYNGPD